MALSNMKDLDFHGWTRSIEFGTKKVLLVNLKVMHSTLTVCRVFLGRLVKKVSFHKLDTHKNFQPLGFA